MERYIVGKILRPHGVRGAMKIEPLTDDISRFKSLKKVFIDGVKYEVINAQISKSEVYLTLDLISNRDDAEKFRNKNVEVEKGDAIKPEEGRYFIADLISCSVFVDDKAVGVLTEVLQNGSADVYVIKMQNKKELMVPALKKLIVEIDIENKKIVLDKTIFEEVVVYED